MFERVVAHNILPQPLTLAGVWLEKAAACNPWCSSIPHAECHHGGEQDRRQCELLVELSSWIQIWQARTQGSVETHRDRVKRQWQKDWHAVKALFRSVFTVNSDTIKVKEKKICPIIVNYNTHRMRWWNSIKPSVIILVLIKITWEIKFDWDIILDLLESIDLLLPRGKV